MDIGDAFFELLRLGLGLEDLADTGPQSLHSSLLTVNSHWPSLYEMGRRQAVLGILFAGAKRLPKELWPPRELLLRWMQQVMLVRRANVALNAKCAEVTELLRQAGLRSCVLKGQGVAEFYPDPLLRQCGDIDVFVWPAVAERLPASPEGYIPEAVAAIGALGVGRVHTPCYHHVEWDVPGAHVEVHFRLSYFNVPWRDGRLWRWTAANIGGAVERDGFFRPTDGFNAVYLMVHLYRHLLIEGVGLRQVMDYAMLLHRADFSAEERHKITGAFNDLGMMRFARGLMWVVQHIFHIADEKLVAVPDEQEGRFLLDEIMRAGNFGQYDDRIDHVRSRSTAGRFWERTKHRARFLRRYPGEVLWDVPFRLYHWCWRKRHRL